MEAAPLNLSELAASLAAIGGFEAQPHIAVAVSGGPDSMALLLLAERWARQQGGSATALIVDHGLRPESAAEAATVALWLDRRGIARDILRWDGCKPRSGIQEAARDARYRLLAEWCRRNDVLHLLTAHHREDQVETHLIRRRAKSGEDGLAAMSAVRELSGCRLVRPLLAVPKARLAALLAAARQPFLTDPSNDNPAFERARLRHAATARSAGGPSFWHPHPNPPALAGEGMAISVGAVVEAAAAVFPPPPPAGEGGVGVSPAAPPAGVECFFEQTRACGHRRIERERELDRLLARVVSLHPAGFATLDRAALAGSEPEPAERLLGRVAAAVGGARYPARRARLARLRCRLAAYPEGSATLGGCRFVPWRGHILVLRELAAAAPPVRLQPGESGLWDRRFFFALAGGAAGGLTLGYLGQRDAPDSVRLVPPQHARTLPRLLHPILPALWDAAGLAAVPHLGCCRGELARPPIVSFRTANPLTRASFTVV